MVSSKSDFDNDIEGVSVTNAMSYPVQEVLPVQLRLDPFIEWSEEEFAGFCEINKEARIERRVDGTLELMGPTYGYIGSKNLTISTRLYTWAKRDGSGIAFGSLMGYSLPNGAMRSPDSSWFPKSRLKELTSEDMKRFIPICPDFVLELRSHTDSLRLLHAKMDEYMENGSRLGWLLDIKNKRAYEYRLGEDVKILENPDNLSGEPILPGFILKLREIWDEQF